MKENKVKIGLEIHVPINTNSKLFCSCSTEPGTPNTRVCEVCLGFPGAKPQLNKEALNKILRLALSLECKISEKIVFARKIYFYPDLSKNYQITQYEHSLGHKGVLAISEKKINLTRVQIEEDPGKLNHKDKFSLVDYNRSGIPLAEIVTDPDFETAEEVLEFMQKLKTILNYLGIYNLEDSSIRADVNVSLEGGERVEIKNVSGVKNIQKAIKFEIIRQKYLLKKGEKIVQRTVHFDEDSGKTFLSRDKESEEDYGYIFEPDLSIIEIEKKYLDRVKKELPELPHNKFKRCKTEYGLNDFEASVIISEKEIADLFEELFSEVDKVYLKNWIIVSLKKVLNYNRKKFMETELCKSDIQNLITKVTLKELTPRAAEFVLREMVNKPESVDKIIKRLNLGKTDSKEIDKIISKIINKYGEVVREYKNGKEKALHFLVGQVVRKTKGNANAKEVIEILKKKLA